MPRTIQQQWAFERCFFFKGSLAGMSIRLRQIANGPSVLPHECTSLLEARNIILEVQRTWDKEENRAKSLKQFKQYVPEL